MASDKNLSKYDEHLVELGGSDFEIADGEPNIKGWKVRSPEGLKIGEVDELLFDPGALKVRYLVIDLNKKELNLDDDRKVLVPIGVAELHTGDRNSDYDAETENAGRTNSAVADDRIVYEYGDDTTGTDRNYDIDEDDEVVIVPATVEQLRELPVYEKHQVTPEIESRIRSIFSGASGAGAGVYNRDDFYSHEHFNEDRFYRPRQYRDTGATRANDSNRRDISNSETIPVIEENLNVNKREVDTGGARIRSRVVERPVELGIDLKEEHVTVQRTPVDRPATSADLDAFKEEELEITEYAEVPVVSKEARVVEEVELNKDVEERHETIRETLRNTEVNEERIDSDKNRRS